MSTKLSDKMAAYPTVNTPTDRCKECGNAWFFLKNFDDRYETECTTCQTTRVEPKD